jgi:hypothetical protein
LTKPKPEPGADDDKPPFGGSWNVLYAIVLLNLAAFVAICYIFTKTYE